MFERPKAESYAIYLLGERPARARKAHALEVVAGAAARPSILRSWRQRKAPGERKRPRSTIPLIFLAEHQKVRARLHARCRAARGLPSRVTGVGVTDVRMTDTTDGCRSLTAERTQRRLADGWL
jgi:hypothetical protein